MLNLYVAESKYIGTTKPANPLKTIGEEQFNYVHSVPSLKCIYFTPPSINFEYPEKLDHNVGIIFALSNKNLILQFR